MTHMHQTDLNGQCESCGAVAPFFETVVKRYHVFTDKGRKIMWAPSKASARQRAESYGLKVQRVVLAPNPLTDVRV